MRPHPQPPHPLPPQPADSALAYWTPAPVAPPAPAARHPAPLAVDLMYAYFGADTAA